MIRVDMCRFWYTPRPIPCVVAAQEIFLLFLITFLAPMWELYIDIFFFSLWLNGQIIENGV